MRPIHPMLLASAVLSLMPGCASEPASIETVRVVASSAQWQSSGSSFSISGAYTIEARASGDGDGPAHAVAQFPAITATSNGGFAGNWMQQSVAADASEPLEIEPGGAGQMTITFSLVDQSPATSGWNICTGESPTVAPTHVGIMGHVLDETVERSGLPPTYDATIPIDGQGPAPSSVPPSGFDATFAFELTGSLGALDVASDGGLVLAGFDLVEAGKPYVASMAKDGSTRWARSVAASSVRAAAAGTDTFAAGDLESAATLFDTQVAPNGMSDVYAARLDASGSVVWLRQWGDAGSQRVIDAAAGAGNLVMLGMDSGATDFGLGPPSDGILAEHTFLVSVGAGGAALYDLRFRSVYAIAVDANESGRTAFLGGTIGPVDVGFGPLPDNAVFVLVLEADGTVAWGAPLASAGQYPTAVAIGADGSVTAAFSMSVVHHDALGQQLWSRSLISGDGLGTLTLSELAVDDQGNAVVAGDLSGTLDLGLGPMVGPFGPGARTLVRLDALGNVTKAGIVHCAGSSPAPTLLAWSTDSSELVIGTHVQGPLAIAPPSDQPLGSGAGVLIAGMGP